MNKRPSTALLASIVLTYAFSVSAYGSTVAATSPQQSNASSAAGSSSASAPASTTTKKKSSKKHHSSKREPTQKVPTPERVSEIQSALARGGYYQGNPNGKWDSNTVSALQKFQSENGLSSSGKIDALSLQKLGLGSGTAGVDAPKPIRPPSSAASTSSSAATPATNTTSASSVTPASNSSSSTPKLQR
jgi:peptidoglycan hydrolase-like protein with peptidoglycan-binding domain